MDAWRVGAAVVARVAVAVAMTPAVAVAQARSEGGGAGGGGTAATWPEDAAVPGAPVPLALPRLAGPVTLDGRLDEAAWAAVPPVPLTMLWPTFGGSMSQRTEIRLAYDAGALYAAARMHEDDPSAIRGRTLDRDVWQGDDAFDLIVDALDDDRTAVKFTVTPRGALLDDEIRNDAVPLPGADFMNSEWDGYWEARTTRDEGGWTAEVRVPFSTLRFQTARDGSVVMGVIAARYISRLSEKHIFPAIPPHQEVADFKPSQARDVRLEGVAAPLPAELAPYVTAGARGPVGGPPGAATAVTREVGADARLGLTSNLTLDATVNTDFAQVESDALQVNLTRFGLFFPEKRDFFQERASVFEFTMGDEARLFHSRTIGLTGDGRPLRILGGARLTGRVGPWDVGVLDLQVDGSDGVPGENAGVARLRRTLADGASSLGGMVTARVATDCSVRGDVGGDAVLRLGGPHALTLQAASSLGGDGAGTALERSLVRAYWERRPGRGLGWSLDLTRSGGAFAPALGFLQRRDFTALKSDGTYTWRSGADSPFTWHRALLTTRVYARNGDGSVESALQRVRWQGELKGGTFLNAALNLEYEALDRPLELPGGARVPEGRYLGPNLFLFAALNQGREVTGDVTLHGGTFLDGWMTALTVSPTWRPSAHLSVGAEGVLNRLWFPDRDQRVVADVVRLRVGTALDTRLSARAFVQYERAGGRFAGDVRVRYRFSEGRDLHLVLTEARTPDLPVEGFPGAEGRRAVLLKYVHTLRR